MAEGYNKTLRWRALGTDWGVQQNLMEQDQHQKTKDEGRSVAMTDDRYAMIHTDNDQLAGMAHNCIILWRSIQLNNKYVHLSQ